MTAPQRVHPGRAPQVRPATARQPVQPLRSVPPIQATPRAGLLAVFAVVLVFAILLGATMLNSSLITGQRQLDQLDRQTTAAQSQQEHLRLKVAQLQSPDRIVQSATAQGMIQPGQTVWLHPVPPATTPTTTPSSTNGTSDGTTNGTSPSPGSQQASGTSNHSSNSSAASASGR